MYVEGTLFGANEKLEWCGLGEAALVSTGEHLGNEKPLPLIGHVHIAGDEV